MQIRKAILDDVKQIQGVVNSFAQSQLMLPLSLSRIYEKIRDFTVIVEDNQIVAVGSLHIVWEDLAEIRSTAVKEGFHNRGYATIIMNTLIDEAREIGLKSVFLLTYQNKFFAKFGFEELEKNELPHKVWTDCVNCAKFPNCDEIAMILRLNK